RAGRAARQSLAVLGHAAAAGAASLEQGTDVARAARRVIALDPPSAHGRLAELFEPGRAPSAVLLEVLRAVDSPLVAADARWAVACARALGDPLLRSEARTRLLHLGDAARDAALATAGVVRLAAPARPKAPLPAQHDFLARYASGAHADVWRELGELGATVRHADLVDEARAVALATMERVRTNLERIAALLRKHGYELRQGKKAVGKRVDASKLLGQIEKTAGGAVPLSLAAFWQVVGSVDLSAGPGVAPLGSPFDGLQEEDPLVVCSATEALLDLKLVERGNKGLPAALTDPMAFRLGPSANAKVDPEAGDDAPPRVLLPDPGVDAAVRVAGGPAEDFVAYLRRAILRGGFLALDAAAHGAGSRGLPLLTEGLLPF
ncbi:MAG: hypothetical protein HY908_30260, partial [Myxococcales bacterium]|nr:hypothetical protein [Myxococcales bacterium]